MKTTETTQVKLTAARARRAQLEAELLAAQTELETLKSGLISGASNVTAAAEKRAARDTIAEALSALGNQIAALESEAAAESSKSDEAAQKLQLESSIEAYDAATLNFDNALRSFVETHAKEYQAINQSISAVNHAENDLQRSGLRATWQVSTLERPRPHGVDVRIVYAAIESYIEGQKPATAAPTVTTRPSFNSNLARAGISVSRSLHSDSPLARAGIE